MPFDGTAPGLGEARLTALVTVLQTGLAVLNTIMALDPWTQSLVLPPFGPVLPEHVRRGDIRALWKPQISATPQNGQLTGGCFRLRVAAAGHRDGLDFTSKKEYIDETATFGRQVKLYTAVYGYLHADAFRDANPDDQSERIEVAQERLSDWMRTTLNSPANIELHLSSQEYWPTGSSRYDYLSMCLAEQGYKSFFNRGFLENEVAYGVHIMHTGVIA